MGTRELGIWPLRRCSVIIAACRLVCLPAGVAGQMRGWRFTGERAEQSRAWTPLAMLIAIAIPRCPPSLLPFLLVPHLSLCLRLPLYRASFPH